MTLDGTAAKRRDAARTRAALLQAALERFGRQGYARTTVREIGEAAGVDPALIARYFGSKAALYVAALEASRPLDERGNPRQLHADEVIRSSITGTARFGPSPVLQAAVSPSHDPDIQTAAKRVLAERTVGPLRRRFEEAGLDQVELRAEVAAAALAGIALARSAGTFPVLANAALDDVVALAMELFQPPPTRSRRTR